MIDKYKCKYIDKDAGSCKHFYFTVDGTENPYLRAKEILADRSVNYANIILKFELGGDYA